MFVGRTRERRILADVVASAGPGGAAVVVRGELGVGKTALLEQVAPRAVWVRGIEEESALPYAAVAELLLPLREHVAALAPALRDALETALALRCGPQGSTFAVCSAALAVLAAAAEREQLVVVVDDHHWLDPASRTVLSFVARRPAEHVVLLFAVRDGHRFEGDLPTLRLGGMPPADCADMVAARGLDVPVDVLADAVAETGGNPLALLTLLDGRAPAGRRSVEREWAVAVAGLPSPARVALFVVAASRREVDPTTLEPVLAELGLGLDDLEPARRRGLVSAGPVPGHPGLGHPMLRSLLAGVTPLVTRIAVFRVLARHAEPDERAWYLSAAATGPDGPAADALAAAAGRAQDRSAHLEAARTWQRAAALTPVAAAGDPDLRTSRTLAAAVAALAAGAAGRATALCDDALTRCGDPLLAADVEIVRGRAHTALGRLPHAAAELLRAGGAVLPHDPGRAARLFAEAAVPLAADNRLDEMAEATRRAEAAGPPSLPTVAMGAAARVLRGRPCAVEPVAVGRTVAAWDLPFGTALAEVRMWLEDTDTAGRLLDAVLRQAPELAQALVVRAEFAHWQGRWDAAHADAAEALRRADERGEAIGVGQALVALARIDAARGDTTRCEERLDRARHVAAARGIGRLAVSVPAVRGFMALGLGEFAVAAEHLEAAAAAAARSGLHGPNVVPFASDLVEAQLHAGDPARARLVLRDLQVRAAVTGLVHPAAVAARCEGVLAGAPESALACFDRALTLHARCPVPFERARTLLYRAEALRRMRRPAAARPVLGEAAAVFAALGARPWTERTGRELAATGGGPVARVGGLTPQESQIARSVAGGLSNTETAAALLLSPRTVEAHLTRVYRKLGIRSRTELVSCLAAPPP